MVGFSIHKQILHEKKTENQIIQLLSLDTGSAMSKPFFFTLLRNFSYSVLINCSSFYAAISVLLSTPIFPILRPLTLLFLLSRGEMDKYTFAVLHVNSYLRSNCRAFRILNSDHKRSQEYTLDSLHIFPKEQTVKNSIAKLWGTHRQ